MARTLAQCNKPNETLMNLVGKGEFLKAQNKKYSETIVFVPFFFGKKQQLKRHADFVNELGYDCVLFNLSDGLRKNLPKTLLKLAKNLEHGWGLKNLWAEEITHNLNEIPGNKIIFGFSSPSTSALKAITERSAKDIKGMICDSGPFYDLIKCNWNYFSEEYPVNTIAKVGLTAFSRTMWGIFHEKDLSKYLDHLPKNFPLLSIRGWLDPLVPLTSIEKVFAGHHQIDLEILNLTQGKHLDGLKNFPEIYKPRVEEFLKSISTKI